MKMIRSLLLLVVLTGLAGITLHADPPNAVPPYIVTVDPFGTTISWATVTFISSGPTYDTYLVTVYTAVIYTDTGEVLSCDSYSYTVIDGGGNDHDAQ